MAFFPAAVRAQTGRAQADAWTERPLRRIEISGLRRTRPEVVLRELRCRPGERIDFAVLERDRLRLLDLGIFAEVAIAVRADSSSAGPEPAGPVAVNGTPAGPPDPAPVIAVTARERPTFLAYPMVGYDSEDGLSYGAYASSTNLRGRNERASALAYAGRSRRVSIGFFSPWIAGRRLGLGLGTSRSHGPNRTEGLIQDTDRLELSADFARGVAWGFPVRLGIEEVRTRPDTDAARPSSAPAHRDDHRYAQIGIWRDTRDSRIRPHRGGVVSCAFLPSGGPLGGDVTFERYSVAALGALSTGRSAALTAAGRFYWSRGPVPAYLRLSLGGSESLRGHAQGEYGGESRLDGWIEQSFPLLPKRTFSLRGGRVTLDLTVDGAVFLDAGSIWDGHALEQGKARGRWGGGAGLRFYAPLFDLIRVDVATDGHDLRIYTGGGVRL